MKNALLMLSLMKPIKLNRPESLISRLLCAPPIPFNDVPIRP